MVQNRGVLNPWEVQVESETEEDVYCPVCDMTYVGIDTRWFTDGRSGTAECPVCDIEIEVIPDDCY